MKKRDLVKAAKELNKVLGLDPKIDIKQEASTIEKLILKAADLIVPEDKISKETAELITDLKAFAEETPDSADEEEEKEVSDTADEDEDVEDEDEDVEDEDEDEDVEDEDEEEDPPAKNTSKGKKTGKAEKSAESPGKKPAGPGVIATIVSLIEGAGKKGVTKEEILTALTKAFPDKKAESMKNTINVQVPNRISKERFPIEKIDGDRYRKAAKA
jgi:cobalamin biosynthesis protein CobT